MALVVAQANHQHVVVLVILSRLQKELVKEPMILLLKAEQLGHLALPRPERLKGS
jgi:hypothetical protein